MPPSEGFRPALLKLVAALERFGIRFHLTGGLAAVVYGEPRLTQDVDVVVDPARLAAVQEGFLAALVEAGFVLGEESARQAIAAGRMFQVLDPVEVVKLDLFPRCLVPGELDRSVRAEMFPGVMLPIVARPDAALSKLVWIEHGSHRSRRDLRAILAGASAEERDTVTQVAGQLGLGVLLEQVLAEEDEIDR